MVKFLFLFSVFLWANIEEEWKEYPEVIGRQSFLYAYADPFSETRVPNSLALWTPQNSHEWIGQQRFPLWSKPSIPRDSSTWRLYLTFGNEVGDMLHQEPRFTQSESNRTPTIETGFVKQGLTDTLWGGFHQIDHWLEGQANYRSKASGHNKLLNPPHSSKSWFGENFADISLLQFGAKGKRSGYAYTLWHKNGWFWHKDRGGIELPIRWNRSYGSLRGEQWKTSLLYSRWSTNNEFLQQKGAGYNWESNSSIFWKSELGRIEPGVFVGVYKNNGLSYQKEQASVLPWVHYHLDLGSLTFKHQSSVSWQLQNHSDSLFYHFDSSTILGGQNSFGKGNSLHSIGQTFAADSLAAFDENNSSWQHTSLFSSWSKRVRWLDLKMNSVGYTSKGVDVWKTDSTLSHLNKEYYYSHKETLSQRLYGARWKGQINIPYEYSDLTLLYRKEFTWGKTWDQVGLLSPKHRAKVLITTSLLKGMSLTQQLQWNSRTRIRGWTKEEFVLAPFWEYDVTVTQRIGAFSFWVSFLNPFAPEQKHHPRGAEHRFRILSGANFYF